MIKNSFNLIIRSYRHRDHPECYSLLLNGQRQYGNPLELSAKAFAKDMAHIEKNYMNSPRSHWWVAVLNDHVVGQVAIQPLRMGDPECYHETSPEERDDVCELRHMVVAQNAQEYGVGSRLMRTFLTFAKEHRYHQVHLSTMTHMDTACQFYEKHDYQRGMIKRYPVHDVENKEWVRFESIETMPKEDQQWMKLPLTISPYRYRQHYWRKV